MIISRFHSIMQRMYQGEQTHQKKDKIKLCTIKNFQFSLRRYDSRFRTLIAAQSGFRYSTNRKTSAKDYFLFSRVDWEMGKLQIIRLQTGSHRARAQKKIVCEMTFFHHFWRHFHRRYCFLFKWSEKIPFWSFHFTTFLTRSVRDLLQARDKYWWLFFLRKRLHCNYHAACYGGISFEVASRYVPITEYWLKDFFSS